MNIDFPTFLSSIGISIAAAAFLAKALVNHQLKKELQGQKHEFNRELTILKSEQEALVKKDVEVFLKQNEASIQYESEAKKRLYLAIGPLKFQLLLAARDYRVRIIGHPHVSFNIQIDRHYGKSTIYRIARLLCLTELIEKQITYSDFSVDESAIKLLLFKKSLFILMSGSKITYSHPHVNWESQEEHIFYDVLSSIGNALIVNDANNSPRCMSFQEFSEFVKDRDNQITIEPLIRIMNSFDLKKSSILWIRLSCVAALCDKLISELGVNIGFKIKPLDLSLLLEHCKDEYVLERIDNYVQLYTEIAKEGL